MDGGHWLVPRGLVLAIDLLLPNLAVYLVSFDCEWLGKLGNRSRWFAGWTERLFCRIVRTILHVPGGELHCLAPQLLMVGHLLVGW